MTDLESERYEIRIPSTSPKIGMRVQDGKVVGVTAGGEAEKCGVRVGDALVLVGNRSCSAETAMDDVVGWVAEARRQGTWIKFTFDRPQATNTPITVGRTHAHMPQQARAVRTPMTASDSAVQAAVRATSEARACNAKIDSQMKACGHACAGTRTCACARTRAAAGADGADTRHVRGLA